MARFSVEPQTLYMMSDEQREQARRLAEFAEEIVSIRNNLAFSIASKQQIREKLRRIIEETNNNEKILSAMGEAAYDAADKYVTTEQRIYSNAGGQGKIASAKWADEYKDENKKSIWDNLLDFSIDLFDEAGAGGKFISKIIKGLTGGYVADGKAAWLDILKDLTGVTGGIASFLGGESYDALKLFGLDFEAKSFVDLIDDEIKKFALVSPEEAANLTKGKVVAKNVSAVAKWAGPALTIITEGVENYNDNKGSADSFRWLKETAGEAAFNIGEDILISAGVGAAVGSVFPGIGTVAGAVVGIIGTVVVKWGINKGFQALTGQKVDEFISDTAIDLLEGNYSAVGETWSSAGKHLSKVVGNAVQTTKDFASAAWNNLTGWSRTAYV